MRIRSRRKSRYAQGSSVLEGGNEVVSGLNAPASLSDEQLIGTGPATGPNHRAFVPIVRKSLSQIPPVDFDGVIGPS